MVAAHDAHVHDNQMPSTKLSGRGPVGDPQFHSPSRHEKFGALRRTRIRPSAARTAVMHLEDSSMAIDTPWMN